MFSHEFSGFCFVVQNSSIPLFFVRFEDARLDLDSRACHLREGDCDGRQTDEVGVDVEKSLRIRSDGVSSGGSPARGYPSRFGGSLLASATEETTALRECVPNHSEHFAFRSMKSELFHCRFTT
jgi:hypothetical protein